MNLLINDPGSAERTLILAHGAGAAMDSDFMNVMAEGLANDGFKVVRFEFPYMAKRRETGKKSGPDREPVLRETWHAVIEHVGDDNLIVGGKSMGGRMASLIADEAGVAGLVCLGYPFHPPGRPEKLRVEHLLSMTTPALFLQGERDTFGNKSEVPGYQLPQSIQVSWVTDGDHSFKPRKASGTTLEDNLAQAIARTGEFARSLPC